MIKPSISIIIPIYKAGRYLRKCLDSVLAQSYNDWELILVDDGSPDDSGKICDEYAVNDSRIRVFHKENGGVSSARNLGLDKAKGEWVTFVDADDCLGKSFFSIIEENPKQDLIITSYCRSDKRLVKIPEDGIYDNDKVDLLFDNFLGQLYFRTPWAKFFRRNLIKTLRFDESLCLGEDTLFCHNYYAQCKSIKVDNSVEYLYTTCDTKSKYSPNVDYVLRMFCQLMSAYSNWGINSKSYNSFIFSWPCSLFADSKSSLRKWYSNKMVRRYYMKYNSDSIRNVISYYYHWFVSYF